MKRWILGIFAGVYLILMSGCIPIYTDDTTHYLVIGIGVVSVNNTNQSMAQITKTTTLGGYATERGAGIGYSSTERIMVLTNSDMVIEVNNIPFKKIKVNVK